MPEHVQYEDDDLFNPETQHEHSDVPVRPLLKALVLFVVFGIATHFAVAFLYKSFATAERKRMDPPQTAIKLPPDAYVPKNQPLLQPFPHANQPPNTDTPVVDLQKMRAHEKQVLETYGWVDRQHGVARIPIGEAKQLLVARLAVQGATGAPAPSSAAAAPSPTPPSGETP